MNNFQLDIANKLSFCLHYLFNKTCNLHWNLQPPVPILGSGLGLTYHTPKFGTRTKVVSFHQWNRNREVLSSPVMGPRSLLSLGTGTGMIVRRTLISVLGS